MAERMPVGHTVHIERLHERGVAIYLDGIRVKKLKGWSLTEELGRPSVLTLTISTDTIVWGVPYTELPLAAPAPIVDDGLRHFAKVRLGGGRVTPSGKTACETCGEAWTCSTYIRRGEFPPGWPLHEVDSPSDTPLG